jgi:hypothetical protein
MTTTKPQEKNLKAEITAILSKDEKHYDAEAIDVFASYCQRLLIEKKPDGKQKNPFMNTKTAEALSKLFKRVTSEGIPFDGRHVTLISRGISYDYVAYKNKMFLAYPESMIDMDVVKDGDTFTASKESGKVIYSHTIADAMKNADDKSITGAYCVIKNKRGEFMTTLSKEDIAKHRKVAQTDAIWKSWFKEMVLKTVLKKACKYHFEDIFEGMNEIDNEGIDLSKVETETDHAKVDEVIKKIEGFKVLADLQAYYLSLAPEFIKNGDVFEAYNAQKIELGNK